MQYGAPLLKCNEKIINIFCSWMQFDYFDVNSMEKQRVVHD